jgi:hypothetical protein
MSDNWYYEAGEWRDDHQWHLDLSAQGDVSEILKKAGYIYETGLTGPDPDDMRIDCFYNGRTPVEWVVLVIVFGQILTIRGTGTRDLADITLKYIPLLVKPPIDLTDF